jgi:aminoglycoside phosphotransferase (APT) family kinase protein
VIDAGLVRGLLREQLPRWAGLDVRPVHPGGWDNRCFRLGDELVARLPSSAAYAAQPLKEHRWLARLAPGLPLAVPSPLALGRPGCGYPWAWVVHRWIEGDVVSTRDGALGRELGEFLRALHRIEAAGGPEPGADNFHRGSDICVYGGELRRALVILEGRVDERAVTALWTSATRARWSRAPVWVHGDIAPGNLLERAGRLAGVIDFGNLAVGDPACDLAIAWTWLRGDARQDFRQALGLDEATWMRARAWALWKALVVAAGISPTTAIEYAAPLEVVERCLA